MRTSKLILLAIGLLAGGYTASACLWGYRIEKRQQLPADIFKLHVHIAGDPLTIELPLLGGSTRIETKKPALDSREEFRLVIKEYEAKPREKRWLAQRNDYAVALIFVGRYRDAITELLATESAYPGQYATASNLGTAYELAGEVENALAWIKTGIARNANSHEGTEWLHVAILETKLKLRDDPQWLETHSVVDGHENRTRAEKEKAFEYQLNERLNFIRENDPVMCDLFYQAALTASDERKRNYFKTQVKRFGSLRDQQVARL